MNHSLSVAEEKPEAPDSVLTPELGVFSVVLALGAGLYLYGAREAAAAELLLGGAVLALLILVGEIQARARQRRRVFHHAVFKALMDYEEARLTCVRGDSHAFWDQLERLFQLESASSEERRRFFDYLLGREMLTAVAHASKSCADLLLHLPALDGFLFAVVDMQARKVAFRVVELCDELGLADTLSPGEGARRLRERKDPELEGLMAVLWDATHELEIRQVQRGGTPEGDHV